MPTPGELLNRRFEKANFGGYKAADVDSFMADLASVTSKANRETAELKRKLEAAEKKVQFLQNDEENIKTTLINAQRLADRIIKDAKEKADITLRDAQIKAEKITSKAEKEIEFRRDEAQQIKQEVSDFKLNIMRQYKTHLELISKLPSIEAPSEEDAEPDKQPADEVENEPEQAEKTEIDATAEEEAAASTVTAETEGTEQKSKQESKEEDAAAETENENAEDKDQKKTETDDKIEPVVKLNLRYNEKTGEYEPVNSENSDDSTDGYKFGADYDISTDSFKN